MDRDEGMDITAVTLDCGAHRAIERLIHQHAWLIDHGQAERVVDLFTEDASLFGVGSDKVGRPAIAKWAEQRATMKDRQTRHIQTNIVLDLLSQELIQGTVLLTLYRHDGVGKASPQPSLVGEYADVYRRCSDDVWRFAERRLSILFGGA